MGTWCPYADSPLQPVPRCGCHSPFSRGDAGLGQAAMRQRAGCVLGSALPCHLGAVQGTQERGEQGLASSAAPLCFSQGPAWHHSALGQHQTLDAFARHQHVGSESLAKRRNCTPRLKVTFFWPTITILHAL